MHGLRKTLTSLLFLLVCLPMLAAAQCGGGGNKLYEFSGRLQVEMDGNTYPVPNAQVRIVRKGSPVKGLQKPDAVTEADGSFSVECWFARDRNGAAPGGQKVQFSLMARFRDDELTLRKGGMLKNNWFEFARRDGCHRTGKLLVKECMDYQFNDIDVVLGENHPAQRHAYIWFVNRAVQDALANENVGLTSRPFFDNLLTVKYPNKNILSPGQSFYLFNVNLKRDHWDDTAIIAHEFMHRWEIGYLKGEADPTCLFDKHHESPDTKLISRCSGFMEGFADATAMQLTREIDALPNDYQVFSRWQLRNGEVKYPVENTQEAERTDVGWANFLKLFWSSNEWETHGGSPSNANDCNPMDIGLYQMLRILAEEEPTMAGKTATFKWFTDIMQAHTPLSDADAELYRLMGNPALSADEVFSQASACGGGEMRTAEQPVTASSDGLIDVAPTLPDLNPGGGSETDSGSRDADNGYMVFALNMDGAYGHALNNNRQQARSAAMEFCGEPGCEVVDKPVQTDCHALAQTESGAYYYGIGAADSKSSARQNAMRFCNRAADGGCEPTYSYCQ